MKKIISVILAVSIIASMFMWLPTGAAAISGQCGDNLEWSYDADTYTMRITGTGDMWNFEDFDVSLNENSWYGFRAWKIGFVEIGEGVTSVGDFAFAHCVNLQGVSFPDSLISIGNSSFLDVWQLKEIILPERLAFIGPDAFNGCYLTEKVVVSRNIHGIGDRAFSGCMHLVHLYLGERLVNIGNRAFEDCVGIREITIPARVSKIGELAFYNCRSLEKITVDPANPTYNSAQDCNAIIETATGTLIAGCKNSVITEEVNIIGDDAFNGVEDLTSLIIPGSVTEIGDRAFYGCAGLEEISIPSNVRKMGTGIFAECRSLRNVSFDKGVTVIGEDAFYDCYKLETVAIPSSLKTIEKGAFNACPWSIRVFYMGTENEWYGIDICELNDKIKCAEKIFNGHCAYYGHDFCVTVSVCPPTCTEDGYDVIECPYCGSTESVNFIPAAGHSFVYGFCSVCGEPDPDFTVSGTCGYDATWTLNTATGALTISGTGEMFNFTHSQTGVYYSYSGYNYPWYMYYDQIKSIVIEEGITYIGFDAFAECSAVESVVIPDSVEYISAFSFYNCSSLYDITIGENVTFIGAYAFYGTAYFDYAANWEDGVLYLDCYLLQVMPSVSGTYTVKEGTKVIGYLAFYFNLNLRSVVFPDSLVAINGQAFSGCFGLREVEMGNNIRDIGPDAFYATGLTNIEIPGSMTDITPYSFRYCEFVTQLIIPDTVTQINSGAFEKCTGLREITVPGSVRNIRSNAFKDCSNISSVHIGRGVEWIDAGAFANCDSLTDVYFEGAEYEWNSILMLEGNDCLTNANIHFNAVCTGGEHDFSEYLYTVYPTCTESGYDLFRCAVCGITEATEIAPTGHDFSDYTVTLAPTCTESGIYTYYCSVCGESEEREVPPLGHDFGDFVFDLQPTALEAGQKSRHCTNCGEITGVTTVQYRPGDADGDGAVSSKDSRLLKQYMSGGKDDNNVAMANADINGDGYCTSKDMKALRQMMV